jgi:hypothetical protein
MRRQERATILAGGLLGVAIMASCNCTPTTFPTRDANDDAMPPPDVVIASSIYGRCRENADVPWNPPQRCRDAVACVPIEAFDVGMCTVNCVTEADCPPVEGTVTACIPVGEGGQGICVVRCDFIPPSECLSGQICEGFEGQAYCF